MPNLPWPHDTVAQLSLIGTCDGQSVVNVHHFEAGPSGPPALWSDSSALSWAAALADDWVTNLKTAYLACHTQDYTLSMVKAQVLERPGQWRYKMTATERPQTSANLGTIATTADNTSTAVVLKWRTAQAGKSTRGRSYLGPLPQSVMSSGLLNTGATGGPTYQAYGTAMLARYQVTSGSQQLTYRMTIYSRPYNLGEYQYATRKTGPLTVVTPGDYAGKSTHVTAAAVDLVLRTQRRRQIGVGS